MDCSSTPISDTTSKMATTSTRSMQNIGPLDPSRRILGFQLVAAQIDLHPQRQPQNFRLRTLRWVLELVQRQTRSKKAKMRLAQHLQSPRLRKSACQ